MDAEMGPFNVANWPNGVIHTLLQRPTWGRRRFQHTKNGDSIGKTARRAQARAARMTAEYRLADPFSRETLNKLPTALS
jgi:hypothetical protein